MRAARPPQPERGGQFDEHCDKLLLVPRIRFRDRGGEADDPLAPRFSIHLPLARRGAWPDRSAPRSKAGVGKGYRDGAGLVRHVRPPARALARARGPRSYGRRPAQGRMGGLTGLAVIVDSGEEQPKSYRVRRARKIIAHVTISCRLPIDREIRLTDESS